MKKISILVLVCLVLFPSCENNQAGSTFDNKFEWEVVKPGEVNLDEKYFHRLLTKIEDSAIYSMDGIIVVRNEKIALEEYFNEFSKDSLHNIASVGKCITSSLVGIAIKKGLIPGTQTKLINYFKDDYEIKNLNNQKQQIEIQHLLTMSSGLACDDWDQHSPGNTKHFENVVDDFAFILDLPMAGPPGEQFAYCSGGANLLGEIIRRVSGQSLKAFAEENLFHKIGIAENKWFIVPKPPHYEFSGGGNSLTPRDMARLGLLYLNRGVWEGDQIISKEWIKASTTKQINTSDGNGYGYFWWIREFKLNDNVVTAYEASGNGGNKITVIPSLDMVIVLAGSGYGNEYVEGEQAQAIIEKYILNSANN